MFVCCECCVLSGRGLCDGLIVRPVESYRLWRVVCDQETSKTRRLKPVTGLCKSNHNGLYSQENKHLMCIIVPSNFTDRPNHLSFKIPDALSLPFLSLLT
jgi:hypothetical protein